jgi:hypothetical protein
MTSIRARYQHAADHYIDHKEAHPRAKLTAGQHILHLLLTVLTCGLWAPVWIWRALRGNPA